MKRQEETSHETTFERTLAEAICNYLIVHMIDKSVNAHYCKECETQSNYWSSATFSGRNVLVLRKHLDDKWGLSLAEFLSIGNNLRDYLDKGIEAYIREAYENI